MLCFSLKKREVNMKIIFTVLLVLGSFGWLNAQNSSNSTAPAGLAPVVTSMAAITLTLHNAIEITPVINWTYGALFMSAADYNGATNAGDMGFNTWFVSSTKPFDISLQFTNLMGDRNTATIMPVNRLAFSVDDAITWNTAALSVPGVSSLGAGKNRHFKLNLRINPGWNYPGGFYGGNVTVTATQN
jgi:hypothetical protein